MVLRYQEAEETETVSADTLHLKTLPTLLPPQLWNSPPQPPTPTPCSQPELTGLTSFLQAGSGLGVPRGGTQLPRVWPVSLHAALLIHTHKLRSGWGPQRLSLQNYQAGLCLGT